MILKERFKGFTQVGIMFISCTRLMEHQHAGNKFYIMYHLCLSN